MTTDPTLSEVAAQIDVTPATLRRWVRDEIVPLRNGSWTPAAIAHARIVARLRARGYGLKTLQEASRSGRLAFGYMEDMFPPAEGAYSLAEAAKETGLEEAMIARVWSAMGVSEDEMQSISEDDLQLLRYIAAVVEAGLPTVAFLQLVRVYGQSLRAIADAEVRLFHLYVHEPLIRDGVPGLQMAEEMEGLARDLLPLSSPIMDHLHQRFLQHFIEQDVVGHLEVDADEELDLGRMRVAIAFADLSGYTRLTEEAGEEQALDIVERFIENVEFTLPDEARVVKTIGDAVMIVSSDAGALTEWAVGFQELQSERPLPRIGIHAGSVLYRDGDYFGRAVNLASRVGARAAAREVLVTRDVVDVGSSHLAFQRIGEVRLKGFSQATELYLAAPKDPRVILALLSGGRDSVCLLDVLAARGEPVEALHVNYGLRAEADGDEAFCRAFCEGLGVRLHVHRAGEPAAGNLQAWARDVRYSVAFALTDGDVATGHTATDQVEGVLYRLAASPGRRALLGMRERDGRVVRPLLGMTREQTAAHNRSRGLEWREDRSNDDPRFARNRTRAELVPALRELHPAAEANVLATLEILRAEAAVLDELVAGVLRGRTSIPAAELAELPEALRRLVFIELAGAPVGHRVDEVVALHHGSLDVGYGRRARISRGVVEVGSTP